MEHQNHVDFFPLFFSSFFCTLICEILEAWTSYRSSGKHMVCVWTKLSV